ncbi:MAG: hypothetical protein CVV64_10435 [Candidatus Wallbacteria bacterium HGW-Wallbacteria-1]|jgi:hypothetical protein|uniref:Uncharacterized protein n=1 Tax=Candidatus Wallbacteria bacterium HGW-Wallbacteria-1 TaxID=2013854 RepID=A0A2N1PP71_9BACT|nr:MAG: hypothetical protein CVV64_10435 [Candidatus Wallbacteria bacterium HGW-Wallbacteria-1]
MMKKISQYKAQYFYSFILFLFLLFSIFCFQLPLLAAETSEKQAEKSDSNSNYTISISDSAKARLLGNEVNFMNSVNARARAMEMNHTQEGVPDSVYLEEPVEADNPVSQSFMSRMQNISRFSRNEKAPDWKGLKIDGKAFVYRFRENKIFVNRGKDVLIRNKRYELSDGRSGRVIGTIEINSVNSDYSIGKIIQGSERDLYEGCYISY